MAVKDAIQKADLLHKGILSLQEARGEDFANALKAVFDLAASYREARSTIGDRCFIDDNGSVWWVKENGKTDAPFKILVSEDGGTVERIGSDGVTGEFTLHMDLHTLASEIGV